MLSLYQYDTYTLLEADTVYSWKGSVLYILTKDYLNSNFTKLKQKCDVSVQYVATDPDIISEHAQRVHGLP
jgi:hypothetical protein